METTDEDSDLPDIKCEVVIKEEPVDSPNEDEPVNMDMEFSIKQEALDEVDMSGVNPLMYQAHLMYQQNARVNKRIKLEKNENEDCLDELDEEMKYEQQMLNDAGEADQGGETLFVNNKIATELVRNQSMLNRKRNRKIVEKLSGISPGIPGMGTPLVDPNIFTCKICKSCWATKEQLSMHIKEKHTSKPSSNILFCNFCDYTFKKKLKLEEHLMACHGDRRKFVFKKQETFTCALCPFKCGSSLALIVHMKVHDEKPHSDGVFRCSECSYQGVSLTSLKSHRYQTHTKNKLANKTWQVDQDHRVVGDQFLCNLCDFRGESANEMKIHRFRTHDKEDLKHQLNFKIQSEQSKSVLEAESDRSVQNEESALIDNYTKPLLGCQLCNFKTLEPSLFSQHMRDHQKNQVKTSLPRTDTAPKPTKPTAECFENKSKTELPNSVPTKKLTNCLGEPAEEMKYSEKGIPASKPIPRFLGVPLGSKMKAHTILDHKPAKSETKPPIKDNAVLKAEFMSKNPNESKKIKITCGKAMEVNMDASKPLLGCHLCKFRTMKDEYMDTHLQKMHSLDPNHKLHCKSYSCIKCQKMLSSLDLFYKHDCFASVKKTKVDSELLKCGICDRQFLDKTFLQRHIKYHLGCHLEDTSFSGSNNLNCPNCDKVFTSALGLLNHVKSVHKDEPKETFDRSPEADKKNSEEKENPRNKALVASDDSGSDTSAESDNESNEMDVEKTKIKFISSKSKITKIKVKITDSKDTSNGSFECPYCNHIVKTNKGMQNHKKDIWGIEGKKLTKPDIKCPHCQFKTNKSEMNMVKHLMEEHTELPRQCGECKFETVYEPIMNHHIKFSHSKKTLKLLPNSQDGGYQCHKCEFKTKSSNNLKSHMFSKHNIKPTLMPNSTSKE